MAKGSVVLKRFKGVNLAKNPREIDDDELCLARNTYPPMKGGAELALRPQTSLITNDLDTGYNANRGDNDSMAFVQLNGNTKHALFIWLERFQGAVGGLFQLVDDVTWRNVLGLSPAAEPTIPSTDRPQFIEYRRKLYVLVGQGAPCYVIEAPTAASGIVETPTSLSWDIAPSVGCVYRDTFCLARFDPANPGLVAFTEVGDPATILSSAKWLQVGPASDEQIVAMAEVSIYGGSDAVEPYMIVWKQRSTWLVQGEPPTSTSIGTLRISCINAHEGMSQKETLAKSPFGYIWASESNVWMLLNGSASPTPIGLPIAPRLSKESPSARFAWHAVFSQGFYKLTIPGSTNGGDTGLADTLPPTEQWWCDLRAWLDKDADGVQTNQFSWWGPMDVPAQASFVERFQDGRERELQGFVRYRSASPSILHIVEANQRGALSVDAHTNLDDTHGAKQEIIFKEYDFGDPLLKKIVTATEVNAYVDYPESYILLGSRVPVADGVVVKMLGDGGFKNKVSVRFDLLFDDQSDFMLDTDELDSDMWSGLTLNFHTIACYPPDGERFVARTFQPVIYTEPGSDYAWNLHLAGIGLRVRLIGRRP